MDLQSFSILVSEANDSVFDIGFLTPHYKHLWLFVNDKAWGSRRALSKQAEFGSLFSQHMGKVYILFTLTMYTLVEK